MADYKLVVGDALETLKHAKSESFQCCITSPPYYSLRDYEHTEQVGQEKTLDDYIYKL
jgi:site-specific DNA-methyltransferase (cytosine-N4-specific)